MGMMDFLTGGKSYTITSLYDAGRVFEEEILTIEKLKDKDKKKRKIENLREKLEKFFEDLEDLGVEVRLNEEDGQGRITARKLKKLDLKKVYKEYIVKTIDEIDKEIKRRTKGK